MTRAPLPDVVRFLRSLPGLTHDAVIGAGAVVGCADRWVMEVQPDGVRWALAAGVWRDGARMTLGWRFDTVAELAAARVELADIAAAEAARLTVHRLHPGRRYRVTRAFTDYYGQTLAPDTPLRFRQLHFLPYAGGYTVEFAERSVYLQESDNAEILANLDAYLAPADESGS